MRLLLALGVCALAVSPAAALAAAKPGSYSGTSTAKYIQVGSATEPTDKGKVAFTVRGNKVRNFHLRGQRTACGPGAELPLRVKTIKLNSSGKGAVIHKDSTFGTLKVSITVTSTGRSSGTIRRPRSAAGLCNPDYPVRFTAKRG